MKIRKEMPGVIPCETPDEVPEHTSPEMPEVNPAVQPDDLPASDRQKIGYVDTNKHNMSRQRFPMNHVYKVLTLFG